MLRVAVSGLRTHADCAGPNPPKKAKYQQKRQATKPSNEKQEKAKGNRPDNKGGKGGAQSGACVSNTHQARKGTCKGKGVLQEHLERCSQKCVLATSNNAKVQELERSSDHIVTIRVSLPLNDAYQSVKEITHNKSTIKQDTCCSEA
eukprot:3860259-Amphidinium_carterae.1